MIKSKQVPFEVTRALRLFYDMKKNLHNVFTLKCVSITNISIEHYLEGVIR